MSDDPLEKAEAVYNAELMKSFLETSLALAAKKAGIAITIHDYLTWKNTLTSSKPHTEQITAPTPTPSVKVSSPSPSYASFGEIVLKASKRELDSKAAGRVRDYLKNNNLCGQYEKTYLALQRLQQIGSNEQRNEILRIANTEG